jgi:tetratricopeptide (TPR) repeat protein
MRFGIRASSFLPLLLLVFPVIAGAQQPGPSHPAFNLQITVRVQLPDGRPAPQGVMVVLEGQGGGMADQCMTDEEGRCTFRPPGMNVYRVSAEEAGYARAEEDVDLTASQTRMVVLELRPLPGQKLAFAPVANGPASVAPAEFNIPENARKEFERGRRSLLEQNDLTSGIAHLEKAIRMHSAFPQAYTLLGLAYLGQPDPNLPKAEAVLKKALEIDPNYVPGCLEMGALLNEQKKYPEAEKALLHALELDPNQPEAHYELAKTYWALGRWQDAEPHARAAAKAMPKLAPVHVVLGNIDLRKRDLPAAVQEYQEYLRLAPDGPMAPATRAMVSRLEDSLAKK